MLNQDFVFDGIAFLSYCPYLWSVVPVTGGWNVVVPVPVEVSQTLSRAGRVLIDCTK